MNQKLKQQLVNIAKAKITTEDPSHDFSHALRVLANSEKIAQYENADCDILVPSALFHDIVIYPKNDPRAKNAVIESAEFARNILMEIKEFPQEKIESVVSAITTCSFSKGIKPSFIEAKILQDADGLEATGAISIMRTFSSTGQMNRAFYHLEDPFCSYREPKDLDYAIDLFFSRLLKIRERMHTEYGKKIAARRTLFLHTFLSELKVELEGD